MQHWQLDGLAAMDALHIAAALSVSASEFVTTEKPIKPMFRVISCPGNRL
ncbi:MULTISPECIES: hypothetical protein [Brasilonema]|nr:MULTISPECIES: hypothetical protein [Brasilonema]